VLIINVKNFFGKGKEKLQRKVWDWADFKTTEGFPISDKLLDWVVGQEKALEECKLCIDEWIKKLLWLKKKKWWKDFEPIERVKSLMIGLRNKEYRLNLKTETIFGDKPPPKEWLPSGPFLLLLGDAGTGKSLIGRALSTYMTDSYKEKGIELNDIVCWRNEVIPSEPKISVHPSPKGRQLVIREKKKQANRGFIKRLLMKVGSLLLAGLGSFILFIAFYGLLVPWITNAEILISWNYYLPIQELYEGSFFEWAVAYFKSSFPLFMAGGSLLMSSVFIQFFGRFFSGNLTGKGGIGGAENTKAPKLIVDNSGGRAPFIDATGHGSAQLFGSIAWDPYQTGGLGTPEHQRASVGDVHRAHLGILYIDEVKNLTGAEAVTLLTVLEDGQLAIALRSLWHGGDTAAMAVSTEPVPCMVFLVAAGNMDSVPLIHYALMDRIYGYGKVVYMNNDMENNVENRRKCVQFIAQEIKRFNLRPFSREACIAVIEESRRKAGRIDRLACKFRPLISIIKTADILAFNAGEKIVEAKHVNEAIREHCKTIHYQALERSVRDSEAYRIIDPKAKPKIGQIHGLGVSGFQSEKMGSVLPIRASIEKCEEDDRGYFNVTGVTTGSETWVQHSIGKLSHLIKQTYKKKMPANIHIDFAQSIGVDGPSAGVAMALALISILDKKRLRQDVAVTGEINLKVENKIIITPVGGVHEKILAAQHWGFKKVLIPKRNYELNINPDDYTIEIVGCETLEDYKKEIMINK